MTPAHEIMHTMGRFHEQTRPDRDQFVTINKNTCEHIIPTNLTIIGRIHNKSLPNTGPDQMEINTRALTHGIKYDYYSVMHYSPYQCTRSRYQQSMSFPSRIDPNDVGQRRKLTRSDIRHIKMNVDGCY